MARKIKIEREATSLLGMMKIKISFKRKVESRGTGIFVFIEH